MRIQLTNGTGFTIPFTKSAVRKEADYHTGHTSIVSGMGSDGREYSITGDSNGEFTVWMGENSIFDGEFEEAYEKFKGALTR